MNDKGKEENNYEYERITWEKYLNYLRDWADYHSEIRFYGMTPACFDEWDSCENSEDEEDDII